MREHPSPQEHAFSEVPEKDIPTFSETVACLREFFSSEKMTQDSWSDVIKKVDTFEGAEREQLLGYIDSHILGMEEEQLSDFALDNDLVFEYINSIGTAKELDSSLLLNLSTGRTLNLASEMRDTDCEEVISVISSSEVFKNLMNLDLSNNPIESREVQLLASSEYLKNIQNLNLAGNSIGDTGVEFLILSENFKKLTELDISLNELSLKSVELIAHSENMPALKHLNLIGNIIAREDIQPLIDKGIDVVI